MQPKANLPSPLNRPIAFYRDAIAGPGLREIIPQRQMLDATIVPEGDAIRLPAEADLKVGFGAMFVQKSQNIVALVPRNLVDMRRKGGIHEDTLPPGNGVRSNDGMYRSGIDCTTVVDALVTVAAPPDPLAVVGRR